ncbi:hypothetical protein BaRGS_00013801, partial [Batillaria attramentaria]
KLSGGIDRLSKFHSAIQISFATAAAQKDIIQTLWTVRVYCILWTVSQFTSAALTRRQTGR